MSPIRRLYIESLKFNLQIGSWSFMAKILPVKKTFKLKLAKLRLKRLELDSKVKLLSKRAAPLTIRYGMLPLNKSYLTSTLQHHTWNYTLPEEILGSFSRMFSGIFMQKGELVTILKLVRTFRTLALTVTTAQLVYRVIEPTFPTPLRPKLVKLQTPHHFYESTEGRDVPARSFSPKIKKARRPVRANFTQIRLKNVRARATTPKLKRKFVPKKNLRTLFSFREKPLKVRKGLNLVKPNYENTLYPSQNSLAVWNMLYQQPLLNYSLKYCRLSRRVRKILKNKYRYSKYYFVIAPHKRRLYTLHLWKYVLKFHDERTFFLKFEAFLNNFDRQHGPDSENLLWSLFYTQQRLALKKLLGR